MIRSKAWISKGELAFQLVFHLLVFLSYSFDQRAGQMVGYKMAFFFNYAASAFVINYLLLPRFFYQKKYFLFAFWVVLVLIASILLEELVLEKIYFPDTRGKKFMGIFYTMLDILPMITILSGVKFAWDALGKQREVEQLKSVVKESQLQFLKSQINPHFLFNNLNNLYSYAIENSPKTSDIILELSGVLRYMLYECREEFVPLSKEVEQLENFTNLSEMQIEERGEVRFSATNIQGNHRIAPLILIVFIENAFKHSTASQPDHILIEVEVELKGGGLLYFRCLNSYRTQSNTDHLSHGIGLENVRKRLQLLYPDAHQLDIRKGDHQYEVRLSIQLDQTTSQ